MRNIKAWELVWRDLEHIHSAPRPSKPPARSKEQRELIQAMNGLFESEHLTLEQLELLSKAIVASYEIGYSRG